MAACAASRSQRRWRCRWTSVNRWKDVMLTRLWFQVDLGFLRFVTAIGTQGAISKETKKHYFVRSYRVDVSSTGEDWVTVKDSSKQKVPSATRTPPSGGSASSSPVSSSSDLPGEPQPDGRGHRLSAQTDASPLRPHPSLILGARHLHALRDLRLQDLR